MNEGLVKFLEAEVEKRKAVIEEKANLVAKAEELKAEYEEVVAKAEAISTDEIEREIVELTSYINELTVNEENAEENTEEVPCV